MQDTLTSHILVKLVVQYDEGSDSFSWTAYGLDFSTYPPQIVTTSGSEANGAGAGTSIAAGIAEVWEGA